MGSLSIVRDRFSQAFNNDLFFNWLRKLDAWPSFRSISELRSNQKPEIPHSFGNNFPADILIRGFMLSMRSGAQ
eukprot:5566122-Amphidinium_carterae.1